MGEDIKIDDTIRVIRIWGVTEGEIRKVWYVDGDVFLSIGPSGSLMTEEDVEVMGDKYAGQRVLQHMMTEEGVRWERV